MKILSGCTHFLTGALILHFSVEYSSIQYIFMVALFAMNRVAGGKAPRSNLRVNMDRLV